MSILIEGLTLPKNDDGTYFIPSYEVRGVEIGAVVMTLMIDQKTQKLRVQLWGSDNPYGLVDSYPCSPVPQHGRLIDEQEIFSRFDNGIRTISSLPLPEDFVALYTQLVKDVKEEIGKCRTIIPASEEET